MYRFFLMVLSLFVTVGAYGESGEMEKVLKPSLIIVGIECRTSNSHPEEIMQHWGKFYSDAVFDKIPDKVSNNVIALYCDYEGDYTQPYAFVIGCQVSSTENIPDGMVAKILPASPYLLFPAIGDFPKSIADTWGTIWQTPLNRTYSGDFEVYGENPNRVDIFIAIE